jgi:small subunit ribosomal protein S11
MGKKRTAQKTGTKIDESLKARALAKLPKRKIEKGILNIRSSYNNTILSLCDEAGNVIMWSSAGALGFKGTKKGTPYAASKVAELVAEKAKLIGIKSADILIKGVGTGRESAIRSFAASGDIEIKSIKDATPVPHGGVKPPKPRRI